MKNLFLIENSLGQKYVTGFHFYNGAYYSDDRVGMKKSSLSYCVSCDELIGKRVKMKSVDYYGTVSSFLPAKYKPRTSYETKDESFRAQIGVVWDGGKQVRECGLAPFWVDADKVEFLAD